MTHSHWLVLRTNRSTARLVISVLIPSSPTLSAGGSPACVQGSGLESGDLSSSPDSGEGSLLSSPCVFPPGGVTCRWDSGGSPVAAVVLPEWELSTGGGRGCTLLGPARCLRGRESGGGEECLSAPVRPRARPRPLHLLVLCCLGPVERTSLLGRWNL